MKIKICGLSRNEDIDYVNEIQPDYIGFVFAKSKRQVTYDKAKQLEQQLNSNIDAVGVFVDEDIDSIKRLVNDKIIDIVQLHGHEDQEYIDELKKYIHCPLIKAIKVNSEEDIFNINYDVDYYLLDGKTPGSGESFDWRFIQKLDKPFFLAGGINLNNIDEALKIDCFAIDVSSGVETNGKKDKLKIEEIVRRVRNGSR